MDLAGKAKRLAQGGAGLARALWSWVQGLDLAGWGHRIATEPRLRWGAVAVVSVLLHAWFFLGGTYRWRSKPERPKVLRGAAYLATLPWRVLAALFSGLVATLVWALVLGGAWALWKTLQG